MLNLAINVPQISSQKSSAPHPLQQEAATYLRMAPICSVDATLSSLFQVFQRLQLAENPENPSSGLTAYSSFHFIKSDILRFIAFLYLQLVAVKIFASFITCEYFAHIVLNS